MSRYMIENEKFMFAMGADRTTSAFFQVWALNKQDAPLIAADNLGVHINEVPIEIAAAIRNLKKRFEIARMMGNYHPNIDLETIKDIAQRLGFTKEQCQPMGRYYDDFDYGE